jgi:hypothetical protein
MFVCSFFFVKWMRDRRLLLMGSGVVLWRKKVQREKCGLYPNKEGGGCLNIIARKWQHLSLGSTVNTTTLA